MQGDEDRDVGNGCAAILSLLALVAVGVLLAAVIRGL